MEFDVVGVAIPKPSILGLFREKDRINSLGQANFDLAKYATLEGKSQVDTLPLENCIYDSEAFIEVHIKAKIVAMGTELPKRGRSSNKPLRKVSRD